MSNLEVDVSRTQNVRPSSAPKRPTRYTPNAERNAEIIRRRKAGEGPRKIARSMDLSPYVVAGVLKRANMTDADAPQAKGRGGDYSPEFKRNAVMMATATSQWKAARAFGVARSTIQLWQWDAA